MKAAPDKEEIEQSETPADEAAEPEVQQEKEQAEGTEAHIPEGWQQQAQALVKGANEYQLAYLRSCIDRCQQDMSKAEYSDEDMPAD